jgi:hypothetical protein
MAVVNGIPFNGGMVAPSGTGGQHIVETCTAICSWLVYGATPGQLFDANAGIKSADWVQRLLYDDAGLSSVYYGDRYLADAGGNAIVDWGAAQLSDLSENISIDFGTRQAIDNGGNTSIDYQNRLLLDESNNQIIHWTANKVGFFAVTPVIRQTGGAATAGTVYTATEQGMLNRVYAALRAYGLLT